MASVGLLMYWSDSSFNVALIIVSSSTPSRHANSDTTAITRSSSIVNFILQPPNPVKNPNSPIGIGRIFAPYLVDGFQPPIINVQRLQPGRNIQNTRLSGCERICAFERVRIICPPAKQVVFLPGNIRRSLVAFMNGNGRQK